MLLARERIATPRTLRTGRAVYRAASRAGLVPGSSSQGELEGSAMPGSFLMSMSAFQARLGSRRLTTLHARLRRRRAIAERYSAWLATHGRTAAHEPDSARHAFLRYPLRVRERDAFLEEAARRGLDLGDWFYSPLYPISGDLSAWGYRWGANPVAERVASEIVNLPTDVAPDGRELCAVEELLEASVDRIM
jgi:perosamine synthetase